MLKNSLSLIFLVSIFFIDQLIGMEDPNLGSVPSLVPDSPNTSQQLPNDVENSQISAIEEPVLEKEFIELEKIGKKRSKPFKECNEACLLIPFHSSRLICFEEYQHLGFTDENLEKYQELLHKLLHKGVNLRPIISAINNDYLSWVRISRGKVVTFKAINSFLSLLIKRIDNKYASIKEMASKEEMENFERLIALGLGCDLCKIFVDYNLLPPLDHKIYGDSLLTILVKRGINIDLLKFIINKERNKDYLEKLLCERDSFN